MKTKLEMAHEYAMVILSNPEYDEKMETLIKYSWIYADAMQAEADKREKKTSCDTNVNFDMYLEYDASINYPPDAWVMYKGEKRLAVSIDVEKARPVITEQDKQRAEQAYANIIKPPVKEWQPDWSQAPADACCWFIGGKSWDVKPYWSKYIPCYKNEETQTTWQGDGMIEAPSFGYTGDWRNSLRKRPK